MSTVVDRALLCPRVGIIEPQGAGAPPGLLFWLRADKQAEEAAGDPCENSDLVLNWIDQVGPYAFTEATIKPRWDASVINGQPAIYFDGTTRLKLSSAPAAINTQVGSLLAVVKGDALTSVGFVIAGNVETVATNYAGIRWNNITAEYEIDLSRQSAAWRDIWRSSSEATNASGTYLIAGGNEADDVPSSNSLRINDSAELSLTYTSGANNGRWIADVSGKQSWTLGCRISNSANTGFFKGWIAEILMYDHELTDADWTILHPYFKHRYALASLF
jgi:hypothetical protein